MYSTGVCLRDLIIKFMYVTLCGNSAEENCHTRRKLHTLKPQVLLSETSKQKMADLTESVFL